MTNNTDVTTGLLSTFTLAFVGTNAVIVTSAATEDDARAALTAGGSAVGHASTAGLLTELLGVDVKENRVSIPLRARGDVIVAQYIGPRLPEGVYVLPPDARIEFRRVRWRPAAADAGDFLLTE